MRLKMKRTEWMKGWRRRAMRRRRRGRHREIDAPYESPADSVSMMDTSPPAMFPVSNTNELLQVIIIRRIVVMCRPNESVIFMPVVEEKICS